MSQPEMNSHYCWTFSQTSVGHAALDHHYYDICLSLHTNMPYISIYYVLSTASIGTQMITHAHTHTSYVYLIGGLEHELYLPIYWECHHPNRRTHIFSEG